MMIGQHAPFEQPWTLQICHLPEPQSGSNLTYNIPIDIRAHIISIDGLLFIGAIGQPDHITAHIERNGRDRSWIVTSFTADTNATTEFHYSLFHKVDFKDKTNKILMASLPEHMWAEPDDQIHIERIGGVPSDQFSQVSITYRAFRISPPPNKLRSWIDAITR